MADDAILSRPGGINLDYSPEADASSLFLKVFANEVLAAFDEYNVMAKLMESRQLQRGAKSAQFLVTGRASAAGLLPTGNVGGAGAGGSITNILQDTAYMNQIRGAEKEVFLDGPIISPTMITEFDEIRSQFDVRASHAAELGRGVAEEFDIRGLLMLANGARAASLITATAPDNDRAGTRIVDADFNSNGASIVATLFRLKRALDAKYVPQMDRHVIITPEAASNLAQQTDVLNRDWVAGANGDFADGTVFRVAGFQLHVSNRLKSADNTSGLGDLSVGNRSGCLNVYSGSTAPANANGGGAVSAGVYSNTVALAFHRSAVGVVSSIGMSLESEYMIEYQSTLLLAKKLCGVSWLRPEACVEITDS